MTTRGRTENVMKIPTPSNSATSVPDVSKCESLLHRIRMIQGRTNLNLSEGHFAETEDDLKKRIKRQQKLIDKCKKKATKVHCYETGDYADSKKQVKLSQLFSSSTNKIEAESKPVAVQRKKPQRKPDAGKEVDVIMGVRKARKNKNVLRIENDLKTNKKIDNIIDGCNVKRVKYKKQHDVAAVTSAPVPKPSSSDKACSTDDVKTKHYKKRKRRVRAHNSAAKLDLERESDVSDEHKKDLSYVWRQTKRGKKPKTASNDDSHLANIVTSAIARLNSAKSSVQQIMKDGIGTANPPKPLHGILKDSKPDAGNSVAKEIDSGKKIVRAQSARINRRPHRRVPHQQTKSVGCLPVLQQKSEAEVTPKDDDVSNVCRNIAKNTSKTLSNLNEQMSNTLKESIAHLNDICMRVRSCLTDIEKDEIDYEKAKRNESTCNYQVTQVEELQQYVPSFEDEAFRILSEPSVETTIERMITTISLANGDMMLPTTPPIPEQVSTEAQCTAETVAAKKKKKRRVKKSSKPNGRSSTKVSSLTAVDETVAAPVPSKVPIWQRQLPSIIEEIQSTVKKQATKSQYNEFLKTLKHLAASNRPVLPPNVVRELQQRDRPKQHKQVYQRLKDIKNALEVTGLSEQKRSSHDKCTCGIKVENLQPVASRQKLQWIKTRSDMGNRNFQAFDILDEITAKDVEPIQSEYPRKDHISGLTGARNVEDTLLYHLVYNQNPKILETLLRSTSFIDETPKRTTDKSSSECQVTAVARTSPKMRPKSASNAYRLYEKYEFDKDLVANPPPSNRATIDLCKEIQIVKPPKSKPKTVELPHVVYSKAIEEKLRLINKRSSSVKSVSKKLIKAKLKPLLMDPNFRMKKIMTIMPVLVDYTHTETVKPAMTKRDVIRKLKPYIFMNFSPPPITVMPVSAKYARAPEIKPSTSKKASPFPKDHGDDCYTGKKLCKRCRMTAGEGTYWSNKPPTANTKNKPSEKNSKYAAAVANRELYKNAENTRSKLKEMRKMAKRSDAAGQDMQNIIEMIEFKIVDILSNPKSRRSEAFHDVEDEIKSILDTMATAAVTKPPETIESNDLVEVYDASKSFVDETTFEQTTFEQDSIVARPASNLSLIAEQHDGDAVVEVVDSEREDAELRDIDENIEKVIGELDALIKSNQIEEVKTPTFVEDAPKQPIFVEVLTEDDAATISDDDKYLTPYMRAVRDHRRTKRTQSFMDFLDELSRLSQEGVALHFHNVFRAGVATVRNVAQIKGVTQNTVTVRKEETVSETKLRKKTKNRRMQTMPVDDESVIQDQDIEYDKSLEYCDVLESECTQTSDLNVCFETISDESFTATRHQCVQADEVELKPTVSITYGEPSLPKIPEEVELTETATTVNLRIEVTDQDTQIPTGRSHRCFTSVENQITQVTEDLKRMCTHTIESQVSELHFKTPSHSISVGTDDKTQSKLSTSMSTESYEQVRDFVCVMSKPLPALTKSKSCQLTGKVDVNTSAVAMSPEPSRTINNVKSFADKFTEISETAIVNEFTETTTDVISIFKCDPTSSSTTKATSNEDISETKCDFESSSTALLLAKNHQDVRDTVNAHKRILSSVYGILFTVMFLGLNMQYSC